MEKVKEKGDFREAVFRLVYRSVAAGMVSAPFDLPEVALEQDVDWGMMDSNAYSFAETYTYDLVTGINQTTERGLRNALTRWIEEGGTMDDLVESIRPVFANEAATRRIENLFKVDRARMIAVTEATRAYVQGTVQYWVAQGFAMPREAPPKHVNCRCDIAIKKDEFGNYWWIWLTAKDEKVCPLCNPYILNPQISIAKAAPEKPADTTPQLTPAQLAERALQKALYEAESEIRGEQRFETGIVFHPDGREMMRKKGDATSVRWTRKEMSLMWGKIMTHNHPGGRSFSPEDIIMLLSGRLSEIRAVGMHGSDEITYSARAGAGVSAWTDRVLREKGGYNQMKEFLTEMRKTAREEIRQELYRNPRIGSNEYANFIFPHLVMERWVEKLKKEGVEIFYDMEVNA